MQLIQELTEVATTLGASLERLSSSRDRFGPAEATHWGEGLIAVRQGCDGNGYEVTIWAGEDIAAKGQAADLQEIVTTMLGRQADLPIRELCRRQEYLEPVGPEGQVEALWHLLIAHGEEYLHPVVTAVTSNPTLRALRPWLSHGVLHLIHPRDRIGSIRYGLAFYRGGDELFKLDVYDRGFGPAETLPSAIDRAAEAAGSW
ncbi:hypothetical protein [Actinoplanes regularis]|uniref:Uncharacterized protein n=1 Tax=Actinoplanes regularis TaxID=52697 RepID=A0A239HZR4_9ACTN|nr:hypothetical protein [Actinoplanes regularis]GIE91302.1 hypothetical protein Are01nite_77820 [Actinoplanes regularis]SNS86771.1 hypothetical protein SAMN06264365_126113 [Actinoplanes regularis]